MDPQNRREMKTVGIVYPHQLFYPCPIDKDIPIFLVEEYLFFKQYSFHKQKLVYHRASMKAYKEYLENNNYIVYYVEAKEVLSDTKKLLDYLWEKHINTIVIIDPNDFNLEKYIASFKERIQIEILESPMFLNTRDSLTGFFKKTKKKFYQTSFYKSERIKRNLLMDGDKPVGGKWTYDVENRKKYPRKTNPPRLHYPKSNAYYEEAVHYVKSQFPDNFGSIDTSISYPIIRTEAMDWLDVFFKERFHYFGDYEDALLKDQHTLHHSILSPMLNTGILTPEEVIDKAIHYADKKDVPINSLEGFVRQIIGWREFIRGIYSVKGVQERTTNYWNHRRKIPKSFYEGSTGILPIDTVIKEVQKTAYAHHIERLMVLGNFMMLCEFDPDEIYQWFMEVFIDAYDWVMVPNVYGMSQFADGGLMSTKPYISGSNYIRKMSDYPKGKWEEVWDALFWRFMDKHRDFFTKNPRLSMLVRNLDKMPIEKKNKHLEIAEEYLNVLDGKQRENSSSLV